MAHVRHEKSYAIFARWVMRSELGDVHAAGFGRRMIAEGCDA